jgi:putative zinc finger/helix-turn-helix YgiT family protein
MSNESNPPDIRPFPWKCGECRQREVYPIDEEYTTEILHDGRSYTVKLPSLRRFRCRNCGEVDLDTEANKKISEAFRQQAGLLTPEEIRKNRKQLGLTQEELAEHLSVAEATLSRWENGWQIQQRCLDKLMRSYFELPQARIFLAPKRPRPWGDENPPPELVERSRKFQLTFPVHAPPGNEPVREPKEQSKEDAGGVKAAP